VLFLITKRGGRGGLQNSGNKKGGNSFLSHGARGDRGVSIALIARG